MIRVSVTTAKKAFGVEVELDDLKNIVDIQTLVDEGDAVILVYDAESYGDFAEEHGLPDLEMLDGE